MTTNLGNLLQVTNQRASNGLLTKCVSKQQLHFMALINAVTLEKFMLRTFWYVTS